MLAQIWTWHPPVGVFIALLGLVSVVVPLLRDLAKIGRIEKALWTSVISRSKRERQKTSRSEIRTISAVWKNSRQDRHIDPARPARISSDAVTESEPICGYSKCRKTQPRANNVGYRRNGGRINRRKWVLLCAFSFRLITRGTPPLFRQSSREENIR
jgi:hypothetical protein